MATSINTYLGELRTQAIHVLSNNTIVTDAPLDNHGKGQSFSPTDLVASALGSCMLTVMGITANSRNMNINGTKAIITKIMAENPRRIAEIIVEINFCENEFTKEEKQLLEKVALTCPVAKSLHQDIKQKISFAF